MIESRNESLRNLARDLEFHRAGDGLVANVARQLRALAASGPVVVLPEIDPARDDLTHWHGLDRAALAREVGADGWNLAAGVFAAENATTAETR